MGVMPPGLLTWGWILPCVVCHCSSWSLHLPSVSLCMARPSPFPSLCLPLELGAALDLGGTDHCLDAQTEPKKADFTSCLGTCSFVIWVCDRYPNAV